MPALKKVVVTPVGVLGSPVPELPSISDHHLKPFPKTKFWTLPNLEFADDNFKFVENGKKFP